MPLKSYGVLKGRPIQRRRADSSNAHYQIHLVDETRDYRVAVNVKSKESPSEVEYLVVEGFDHPVAAGLPALPQGFTSLPRQPGGLALDFIRANLFDRTQFVPLPMNAPGADDDLNDKLDAHVQAAMSDEDALVYAFGERWGPENVKDKVFGFLPGNGVHDIHMNQGNSPGFADQDGVWQDGGLILHFPGAGRFVGVFLKFQSQAWHTHDVTGHALGVVVPPNTPPDPPVTGEPDLIVRIVAALVNPLGPAPEPETVTLLNTSPAEVRLDGWALADTHKNRQVMAGAIAAGATRVVEVAPPVALSNKGGIVSLLDANGLKVHGVAYTKAQAEREGWTLTF
jgi:uncharacterized protein YukJ